MPKNGCFRCVQYTLKTCAGVNAQEFGGSAVRGKVVSCLKAVSFVFGAGGQEGEFLALGGLSILDAQKFGNAE